MMKAWKIDEETLFEQCMRNTLDREKHEFTNIKDVITKLYNGDDDEFLQLMLNSALEDSYVLTNEARYMGANVLLNQTLLHNLAMQNESNLIIYPSSLNEVIAILEENYKERCMDTNMVKQINEEKVYREEWLSNSVYKYDREQEKLVIYQQGEPLCNNVDMEAETMAC